MMKLLLLIMTVSLGVVIGLSHNETDMALYQYSTYVQENELYLHFKGACKTENIKQSLRYHVCIYNYELLGSMLYVLCCILSNGVRCMCNG